MHYTRQSGDNIQHQTCNNLWKNWKAQLYILMVVITILSNIISLWFLCQRSTLKGDWEKHATNDKYRLFFLLYNHLYSSCSIKWWKTHLISTMFFFYSKKRSAKVYWLATCTTSTGKCKLQLLIQSLIKVMLCYKIIKV